MSTISFIVKNGAPQSGVSVVVPNQEPSFNVNLDYVRDTPGPQMALVGGEAVITVSSELVAGANCDLVIGEANWTEAILAIDASIAVDKKMECRIELARLDSLQPDVIRAGQRVVLRHFQGNREVNRIEGYTSGRPRRSDRSYTVEVTSQPEVSSVNYCGALPGTAGELARIYCEANGLQAVGLPEGHTLNEQVDNFVGEPLQILSDVYSPTDYDVFENFQGKLEVVKPSGSLVRLGRGDYMKISHGTSAPPLEDSIAVENTFQRYDGFVKGVREYDSYSDNYNVANTYPFFSGGWTRSHFKDTYLGATLVTREEQVFGRITSGDVFAADVVFLECNLTSPVATTEQLLYTRETQLYTARLASGYDVVYAEEFNVNGTYVQSGQEDRGSGLENKWFIRNGQIERQVKKYVLEQQTNSDLCERDQAWFIVDAFTQKWDLLNGGQYSLTSSERTWFTADRPTLEGYKTPRNWIQYRRRARYDAPTGNWVETPVESSFGTQPSEAGFIKPLTTPIQVSGAAEVFDF